MLGGILVVSGAVVSIDFSLHSSSSSGVFLPCKCHWLGFQISLCACAIDRSIAGSSRLFLGFWAFFRSGLGKEISLPGASIAQS